MSKRLIVAIDGPAGSGKSTSAKLVAQKLGYLYIDTGAMYRAVTFLAIRKNVLNNSDAVIKIAQTSDINLKFTDGATQVRIDGENITDKIRTAEVNSKVSDVSKIKEVRSALVAKQREMAMKDGGVVMEGRDIGTVVFPDADVKIFLTASIEQRAKRRAKEFEEKGINVSVNDIKDNLINRDKIDSTREVSPLTKAEDAIVVDTSKVTIQEQVDIILDKIRIIAAEKNINLN
jgi:CMP/dCMP kinase